MATANEPENQPPTDPPAPAATDAPPADKAGRSPERSAAEIARLDRLLVLAVLTLAFLLGSFTARNSDFWMHLATGRAIATGQYSFGTDPFAYTTAGVYWANHSWLFDWLLYVVTSALGGIDRPSTGAVLVAGKALLATLLTWLLLAIRRRDQSVWLPAACVGLAVLVLSPRLHLQPTIVSYLFLGLTLFLLAREGKRERTSETRPLGVLLTSAPRRLYALPPLFLLWVNLDSWFLLGPVLVALCLVGDLLQAKLAPLHTPADTPKPGETRAQCLALVLGLAACLVSPHHVHAFVLPPDLFIWLRPAGLGQDPAFANLFISPLGKDYFTAAVGQNLAGLAYFVLVGLGILSFAVNSAGTRGWRTLTWLVFCLLSAANQRFIPFFAIVAGPITALNLQDLVAARRAAAVPEAGRGFARAGRVLTLLVLLVLIAGAWFGLLHAHAGNPRFARRVAWTVEIDPSLRKAAGQLAAWRQAGQLPEGSRGLACNADLANYFAWFCPAEKSFFDHRYPLFAGCTGDYARLRRWLEGRPVAPGEPPMRDWLRISRERHIDHVVLTGGLFNGTVRQLLQFPREWPLLYLDGRTAIFGWNGWTPQADRFAGLRFDLSARAFGPNPDRAPPDGLPRSPRPAGDWEQYWQPPPPLSLDREEATADLDYFDAVKQQWQDDRLKAVVRSSPAACVGAAALATDPAAPGAGSALVERLKFALFPGENRPGAASHGRSLVSLYLRGPDLGPPAAPLVALRAARRAQVADPDDAVAHWGAARAALYLWSAQENYWAPAESPGSISPESVARLRKEVSQRSPYLRAFLRPWVARTANPRHLLRQIQVVVALQDALVLKPADPHWHQALAAVYWHMGYFDLALDHLRAGQEMAKAAPAPEDGARKKEHELRLGRQQQFVQQVEKEVNELRNEYELHAANLPPSQRRLLAFAPFGLAKLALASFAAMSEADMKQLTPPEAELYLYLLVTTGQTRTLSDPATGKPGVLPDRADLKRLLGREFAFYQGLLAAAVGDSARAGRALEEAQPPPARSARPPLIDMLQPLLLNAVQPHPLNRLIASPFLEEQFQHALAALAQQRQVCDFLVLRGLVALDGGDVEAARGYFRAAIRSGEGLPPFESRPIAVRYLGWMGRR